jgi:hypothetical protein
MSNLSEQCIIALVIGTLRAWRQNVTETIGS